MNLGGLSAVYPGQMAAEQTQLSNDQSRLANEEAVRKALAQQILGRAFGAGQQGPQPPAPGQPSVPAQQPQMVPMPQPRPDAIGGPGGARPPAAPLPGGGAPIPPQGQPQAAAPQGAGPGGMPEISLQALTQRILQTTPQVAQHPELLMAALERAAPILDRQSKQDLLDLRQEMQRERLKQTGDLAQARIDAAKAMEQGRNERAAMAEEGRNTRAQGRNERTDRRLDQADKREERLAAASAVRQDQRWQQLEQQKQALAQRAQQGGDRQALAQWRAIVDAQHKRATEILQANNAAVNMKAADRKNLLADQDAFYRAEIEKMRGVMGSSTPTGGTTPAGEPAAPKTQERAPAPAAAAPAASGATPPLAMLKQGTITKFANGQEWTIGSDGQPKQVK